jgi:exopolyphosphatase/guanosine-5'-triphosphate,3'-diphosphate pyrophosphatase
MAQTRIAAAIDIGTNSVKITIGRLAPHDRLEVLADRTTITRLGKGVDAAGRLTEEAMQATLAVLASYAQEARNWGAHKIAAVGTSALRDAANGADFVRRAERDLEATVNIITGDREAALIYLAARHDPDLSALAAAAETLVTTDIGGGSTEVVVGSGEEVSFRKSLQIGAVRLTERCLPSDPPAAEELNAARQAAHTEMTALPPPQTGALVVASGGTAANLAAMALRATDPGAVLSVETLHGVRLSRESIETRIVQLSRLPLRARRETPGLEPARADVIIGGAIIQAAALERLGAKGLIVSSRGLRFGLLYELLHAGQP